MCPSLRVRAKVKPDKELRNKVLVLISLARRGKATAQSFRHYRSSMTESADVRNCGKLLWTCYSKLQVAS